MGSRDEQRFELTASEDEAIGELLDTLAELVRAAFPRLAVTNAWLEIALAEDVKVGAAALEQRRTG